MKIIAIVLRVLIIIVWIKMILLGNGSFDNPPFVSGIWFVLTGLYLVLQAIVWPKSMLCPIFHWCGKESCKK